jgi:hypothetical protein
VIPFPDDPIVRQLAPFLRFVIIERRMSKGNDRLWTTLVHINPSKPRRPLAETREREARRGKF